MKNNRKVFILLIGILLFSISLIFFFIVMNRPLRVPFFDKERAYQDVIAQTGFGPRIPGSDAHQKTIEYIQNELIQSGWEVEIQETEKMGHPIKNIIARRGNHSNWIILGAHYDSRFFADQDPVVSKQTQPVPGANDGASGVAVLLELARVLPKNLNKELWLVFFDAEDQGKIPGWDWILGSRAFVESLKGKPDAVVVIDMIGDADLNIYREILSDQAITASIWNTASRLGYQRNFIDQQKYSIIDDHLPFLESGIHAIDIIDFDYPYWHTTLDTLDKVSPVSLSVVGNTLINWLLDKTIPY